MRKSRIANALDIPAMSPHLENGEDLAVKLGGFLNKHYLPLQLRLDLLDVFCGLRPAARVLVRPDDEAAYVCQDVLAFGCSIAVGKGMKWQSKSSGTTCHDWFSDRSDAATLEAMAVLYVAGSESTAQETKAADETRDDVIFAQSLGYPECCIDLVRARKRVPELSECIALYAPGGIYDPLVWPGAMLYDAPLTPHYPCSPTCAPSQALAQARVKLLVKSGCFAILKKIVRAREMIYFADDQGRLHASLRGEFVQNGHTRSAKPNMPAADRLGVSI